MDSLSVPIKERLVWQGKPAPHSKHLRCLCCYSKSGVHIEDAQHLLAMVKRKKHKYRDGVCKHCGMRKGIAADNVSCGSRDPLS